MKRSMCCVASYSGSREQDSTRPDPSRLMYTSVMRNVRLIALSLGEKLVKAQHEKAEGLRGVWREGRELESSDTRDADETR